MYRDGLAVLCLSLFLFNYSTVIFTVFCVGALSTFFHGRAPLSDTDIALAIRIDDISLLEAVFQAQKPVSKDAKVAMLINCPENNFNVDDEAHRLVLRSVVTVRYELGANAGSEESDPDSLFGMTLGVVASVSAMGDAAVAARHMAGNDDAVARRDNKMAHALRLEAIKAGHAFASAKLAELSALSPSPKVLLPAIDADELLHDLEKQEIDLQFQKSEPNKMSGLPRI